MKINNTIVLLSQHLRVEDNPALSAACKQGGVIPTFIYSPENEGKWPPGAASRWWLHHSLTDLEASLKKLGLPLIIRKGHTVDVVQEIIQESSATAVYWNRRYEPSAIKLDERLRNALFTQGIETQTFHGTLLFEPWSIANKQGKPFQVFTPFWKACLSSPLPEEQLPPPHHITRGLIKIKSDSIESLQLLPKISWDEGLKDNWKPGSSNAKPLLRTFLNNGIEHYPTNRDRPDIEGVSRMSPYLHFGEITPRMIWHEVIKRFPNETPFRESYLRQLGWREFAHHLLYHFPSTPEAPLRTGFVNFPWNCNEKNHNAWKNGLTGYPIVDAGMRELWHTGWMHNRVRMIVGSFLVKDLLISWNEGARWFWDTLVDADLANNTLGWQWVGGCGADAAPYFRIFNPITQGEKFDPEGHYVRKWVPELSQLPNKWIHRPWEAPELILRAAGIILGNTYPAPIIDHAAARLKALEAFASIGHNASI
jgi:deoxyribodipyrimidine photo-lyase